MGWDKAAGRGELPDITIDGVSILTLLEQASEAGRQEGKESPGRFECGNCHEVMLYKIGPLIEEIRQEERERAKRIVSKILKAEESGSHAASAHWAGCCGEILRRLEAE